MNKKRIVGIVFLALVLSNFFLFIFTAIKPVVFWVTLGLAALVAYVILPRIKDIQ